jgi:hypothetical protein
MGPSHQAQTLPTSYPHPESVKARGVCSDFTGSHSEQDRHKLSTSLSRQLTTMKLFQFTVYTTEFCKRIIPHSYEKEHHDEQRKLNKTKNIFILLFIRMNVGTMK